MLRLIIIIVVVFYASIAYYGSTRPQARLERVMASAVVESFEYGYACRAAEKPYDECLARIKKMLDY